MRIPVWAWVVSGAFLALSILFFFQYKDPMMLIFGLIVPAMLLFGLLVLGLLRGGIGGVRVRCRECSALNLEDARFCAQCGRPMQ